MLSGGMVMKNKKLHTCVVSSGSTHPLAPVNYGSKVKPYNVT